MSWTRGISSVRFVSEWAVTEYHNMLILGSSGNLFDLFDVFLCSSAQFLVTFYKQSQHKVTQADGELIGCTIGGDRLPASSGSTKSGD